MNNLPTLPSSKDVIREASNKLKIVEHQRELEEKFFQKYEDQNEYLKKFEKSLSKSLYYDRLKSSNINEKSLSKIYSLLENFSKLEPNQISNISKILVNKKTVCTQTDTTDESTLINKIQQRRLRKQDHQCEQGKQPPKTIIGTGGSHRIGK